ncbi:hypothetical protein BD560DRAFT_401850 [Blakeslea trispora]|nr:hypothetical protein BD560DRAFT_401850 [Blakeslea trispora]
MVVHGTRRTQSFYSLLSSDYSVLCLKHSTVPLTKTQAIQCLQMHRCLMMPETVDEPLSFLSN